MISYVLGSLPGARLSASPRRFSEWAPWVSSISRPWELVRNAVSGPAPHGELVGRSHAPPWDPDCRSEVGNLPLICFILLTPHICFMEVLVFFQATAEEVVTLCTLQLLDIEARGYISPGSGGQ